MAVVSVAMAVEHMLDELSSGQLQTPHRYSLVGGFFDHGAPQTNRDLILSVFLTHRFSFVKG
jgi:hypothetical protein